MADRTNHKRNNPARSVPGGGLRRITSGESNFQPRQDGNRAERREWERLYGRGRKRDQARHDSD
jgi:hypothetical protein